MWKEIVGGTRQRKDEMGDLVASQQTQTQPWIGDNHR